MNIAHLQVLLDATKALEQTKQLQSELLKAGIEADKMSKLGNAAFARLVAPIRGIVGEFKLMQSQASTASGQIQAMGNSGAASMASLTRQATNAATAFSHISTNAATAANQVNFGMRAATAATTSASSSIRELSQYLLAYISIRQSINIGRELIDANLQMQRLQQTLSLTSNSAGEAAATIGFLRQESRRIGTVFIDTATSFARFKAAAMGSKLTADEVKEAFVGVAEASTRLHLDAGRTQLVFMALEQMISKGVVSMEELRRQLGDSLPGAFQIAARGMKMTTAEFMKLVESGKLMTDDFLPKFIAQLRHDIPIGDAGDSMAATIGRVKTAWLDLKLAVSQGIDFNAGLKVLERGLSGAASSFEASALLAKHGGEGATGGMFNPFRGGLPGAVHRYNTSQNYGNLTPEQQAAILATEFPSVGKLAPVQLEYGRYGRHGENQGPAKQFNFGMEYERMKALEPTARETLEEFYGKPGIGVLKMPEKEATVLTDKQKEALQEIAEMRAKFHLETLDGLAKEQAKIDENLRKQIEGLQKLEAIAPPGSVGLDDYAAAYSGRNAALGIAQKKFADQETERTDRQNADEARELTNAYKELVKIESEAVAGSLSGRDRELAEVNAKWKEQYATLIEIDETMQVSEDTYAAINDQLAMSVKLINERYEKAYVGEGTLIELNTRRLALEQKLLLLNENDPTAAREAKKIQEQMTGLNKQIDRKLKTGEASPAESFIYGWERAVEQFGTLSQRIVNTAEGMANSISDNMTNALMDWASGTKDARTAFAEMTRAIVADLLKIMIQQLIVRSILSAMGSIGGGGTFTGAGSTGSAGVNTSGMGAGVGMGGTPHTGGVAGAGHSYALPNVFAGARRYHEGGVLGDEVPLIARKREVIFTPEQMAALGESMKGGGKGQSVEIVNVVDEKMLDEHLATRGESVILNVISKNRPYLKKMLTQ